MLELRVFGETSRLEPLGRELDHDGAARAVALAPGVRPGHSLLTAEVHPETADEVLALLTRAGVSREDVALARLDDIGPFRRGRATASLVWADVLGQASVNARPVARYLVFMIVAGIIAAFGVIEVNGILIVGAMAVAPDLLPVTAACVALVAGRARLAARAIVTLVVGLFIASAAGALLTAALDRTDLLPSDFVVGNAALSGLTTINVSTIGVALAAGVAGMLAVETRASAAVGVGISITTIPAAAYLGVAAGASQLERVLGAGAVLWVNITMLLIGGTVTLAAQRRLAPLRGPAGAGSPGGGPAGGAARGGRAAPPARR
jgi:uncharacterized hydrophobic protein (TIGR00271 family)